MHVRYVTFIVVDVGLTQRMIDRAPAYSVTRCTDLHIMTARSADRTATVDDES